MRQRVWQDPHVGGKFERSRPAVRIGHFYHESSPTLGGWVDFTEINAVGPALDRSAFPNRPDGFEPEIALIWVGGLPEFDLARPVLGVNADRPVLFELPEELRQLRSR